MSPRIHFASDEARVVHLAQKFEPSYMREYLKWVHVWQRDRRNGRGLLPPPVGNSLLRGSGLFWEILDRERGRVQCFQATAVRLNLEARLEEQQ